MKCHPELLSLTRLSWKRGVELSPFEVSNTRAVELAVDLAHGQHVQRISSVSVSNGLAVKLYQLLCDVTTRPASCRGLTFRHFLCRRCRPCTSAYRFMGRGEKISKGFFRSRDPAMSTLGGLTMGRTAEGRPAPVLSIEQSVRTACLAAYTHTPAGPALSNRMFPPTESRQNGWQMTLPPLQMLPQPSPRGAVSMTEEMQLLPYAMTITICNCSGSCAWGVEASLGDCNSAGSLNNRGPPHELR